MTKKKLLEKTKIIIFTLKIYLFILRDNKENFINKVYEFEKTNDNSYKVFINYFKKIGKTINF